MTILELDDFNSYDTFIFFFFCAWRVMEWEGSTCQKPRVSRTEPCKASKPLLWPQAVTAKQAVPADRRTAFNAPLASYCVDDTGWYDKRWRVDSHIKVTPILSKRAKTWCTQPGEVPLNSLTSHWLVTSHNPSLVWPSLAHKMFAAVSEGGALRKTPYVRRVRRTRNFLSRLCRWLAHARAY